MVDDTYYITPHEAALAVVATAMKKSRLPFYILCINSIMGAFLFSAGGMLYVMCEAGSRDLIPGAYMFVYIAQGAVYAIGLFYVIVCGMELFNSNILFFSVGVMRGAVTLMDLFISWFVSFWINLAATIFVVYVFCYLSGILKQEHYVAGTLAIATSKNSFSFAETMLKGIAGNFFVCLAVYLQIMVKPLHVKFLMIFLPIFTFVAMGFTHVVADMFLVPAAIFNGCGYGFGHYFWKIMLSGAIGNIIGGSFFGIVIPWFLHLYVIEKDMKKLKLPVYEERDEQPMLNMDSRVIRVPTQLPSTSSSDPSIQEFKPDDGNDISTVYSNRSAISAGYAPSISRVATTASFRSRHSRQIRSPKGVFPVVDMGEPLTKEKTIASTYLHDSNKEYFPTNIDSELNKRENINSNDDENNNYSSQSSVNSNKSDGNDNYADHDNDITGFSGNNSSHDMVNQNEESIWNEDNQINSNNSDDLYMENPYDPDQDKVGAMLIHALSRTLTRNTVKDIETGDLNNNFAADKDSASFKPVNAFRNVAPKIEPNSEIKLENIPISSLHPHPPLKNKLSSKPQINQNKISSNKLFRQFTFGGGGNDNEEIRRRLSNAKITRKAAGMSNDIAGIHVGTIDSDLHDTAKRKSASGKTSKKKSIASSKVPVINDSRLGGPYASDRWQHFTYDYELDEERPVSFISEESREDDSDKETGTKKLKH
jgi:formate/nitrite transporter